MISKIKFKYILICLKNAFENYKFEFNLEYMQFKYILLSFCFK